jgi:hypothetical protein
MEDNKFDKVKKWLQGTGMPNKLSPAYEHSMDKSPDATIIKPAPLKMNKKLVKL